MTAPRPHADLLGRAVRLDPWPGSTSPLRSCPCGSTEGTLTPGIASHPLSVRCAECGRHVTRLTERQIGALRGVERLDDLYRGGRW